MVGKMQEADLGKEFIFVKSVLYIPRVVGRWFGEETAEVSK
jgi:hypothetical protein